MQSEASALEIDGKDAHCVRRGYRFPGGCFELRAWFMPEADFVSYFLEHHRFDLAIDGEAIPPSSVSIYPERPELTAYEGITLWVRWNVYWTYEFEPHELSSGTSDFVGTYVCIPPDNELQGYECFSCFQDLFPTTVTKQVTVLASP